MNVLIAYWTTEGQTRKAAERAVKHIRDRGPSVELYDSQKDADSRLDLGMFQAFIVAASVHQEQQQKAVKNFATAHPRSPERQSFGLHIGQPVSRAGEDSSESATLRR